MNSCSNCHKRIPCYECPLYIKKDVIKEEKKTNVAGIVILLLTILLIVSL